MIFSEEAADEILRSAEGFLHLLMPLVLMREVTQPQDGCVAVLRKLRERYFRFTDPVFKVYARLRTWKFNS
jgi:hypothetical protein